MSFAQDLAVASQSGVGFASSDAEKKNLSCPNPALGLHGLGNAVAVPSAPSRVRRKSLRRDSASPVSDQTIDKAKLLSRMESVSPRNGADFVAEMSQEGQKRPRLLR